MCFEKQDVRVLIGCAVVCNFCHNLHAYVCNQKLIRQMCDPVKCSSGYHWMGEDRNNRSLVMGGGRACYAVGERRQDEVNGGIQNLSDCER